MAYLLYKSFINDLDGVDLLCRYMHGFVYFTQCSFTSLTEKLEILDILELSWCNICRSHAFVCRWLDLKAN